MKFLTKCSLLALTMTLASATCASSDVAFDCAPESYLRDCSSAALWSTFEGAYSEEGDADHPPGTKLDPAVADRLQAALEQGRATSPKVIELLKGLPTPVVLAWQLAAGQTSPQTAAHAARALEYGAGQRAVLQMLVHLDRKPTLVAALDWTLDLHATRAITLPWLLLARNERVTALVLQQLIQCHESMSDGCSRDLPNDVVFTVAQLQTVWPRMSQDGRRAVILRTDSVGLESFLRRELLAQPEGINLHALADFETWGSFEVQTILAQLLMEQLLDPAVSQSERFALSATIPDGSMRQVVRPYLDVELSAWRHLSHTQNAPAGLWPALAGSGNPWISMLGVAALIAENRANEADSALIGLTSRNGAPNAQLLQLLKNVDSPDADLLFQRALQAPVQNIYAACQMAKFIGSERRRRIAPSLINWVQRALATVPANQLPKLQDIRKNAPEESLPEPMRSVICVVKDAMPRGQQAEDDSRGLAAWLEAQPAELYVLLGAFIYGKTGDLQPLKRFIDTSDTQGNPKRQEVLKSLEEEYQRLHRELEAAEAAKAQ